MYLERLQLPGADVTNNPNEYFKPYGKFNPYSPMAEISMPNCTTYSMLASNEACDALERMVGIAIKGSIGYHNAKYWYAETGLPKGPELREGSIAVFDGNAGHVAIVATKIDATHATITHSQFDPNKMLRNYKYWQRIDNQELVVGKSTLPGVGKLLGFIYLPINDIRVNRDETKNQIEVVERFINVRKEPSLSAESYRGRFCPMGIYNVYNFEEADGYTWYKLESKHWIAGVDGVIYHEATKQNNDQDIQEPTFEVIPVERDDTKDQIFVNNNRGTINIRKEPTTASEIVGTCLNKVYYNVVGKENKSDYTWYEIGSNSWVAGLPEIEYLESSQWVEPKPVKENRKVNQIYIDNNYGSIRIRKTPSLNGEVMGYVENLVYYNVLDTQNTDMTWYHIGDRSYVAGISEVKYKPAKGEEPTWEEPTPVEKDNSVNQIYVSKDAINIRKEPTTKSEAMSTCKNNSYYNVLDIKNTSSYTWYNIGDEAWVAGVNGITYFEAWESPQPVKEDSSKDQLYVGDVVLNIRKEPSIDSKKMGVCESNSNYDVLGIINSNNYTWYELGNKSWVAGIEDVIYYPKGSSRIVPELKKEIPSLKTSLDIALKCVNKNISSEHYDELYEKVKDLNNFINENFDSFDYDVVDTKEYDEIDLLYTADVHGAWVGYDEDGNYLSPVFNYDDVSNYRSKLKKNNIKALLVDCGDWSRPCRVYDDYVNTGKMVSAQHMNEKDYFASTYGNHEWRWDTQDNRAIEDILGTNKSITACNLFKNGKLMYKPYRTAKIGSKRIAVIGIGYPSANGVGDYSDGIWTYGDYTFLDGDKLFAEVQKYIDLFKENNFDYIVVATHMCKSTYESDKRYNARTDTLIQNTSGLTAVLQGHYNFATNAETIIDKGNNSVLLAHEAGANMNSFGRLQLKGNRVSSYLLDERSDLNNI